MSGVGRERENERMAGANPPVRPIVRGAGGAALTLCGGGPGGLGCRRSGRWRSWRPELLVDQGDGLVKGVAAHSAQVEQGTGDLSEMKAAGIAVRDWGVGKGWVK